VQLKSILKEKRGTTGRFPKGVLFFAGQCPGLPNTCNPEEAGYLGFHCLYHPPYSPDLAPSDYNLFPGLKKSQ
jgi:hypothetical protein